MRLFNWVQRYLLYVFPVVLFVVIWSQLQSEREIRSSSNLLTVGLWEVTSWSLIIWFFLLPVFILILTFSQRAKDEFFKKISLIRERDEREELITGVATKRAFVSTLSLLILLVFLSAFKFNITKLPPEEAINGKSKTLSISMGFKLLDDAKVEPANPDSGVGGAPDAVLVESRELPLSKTAILLLVIGWQLAVYRLSVRRESMV
ncbi:MAG: hypothetical protein V4692_05360 [Bdellovibrionota bacterium]